jgi:orotate phosphoribosyltransferase-like protein
MCPSQLSFYQQIDYTFVYLIFQSNIQVKSIRNIDIDPECEQIANTVNRLEEIKGTFRHVTMDMTVIRSDSDVCINTSCEHITQDQYDLWLSGLPQNSLIVLQSNNFQIDEHVNCSQSLNEFIDKSDIECFFSGELALSKYNRYLLIGKKYGHRTQNTS